MGSTVEEEQEDELSNLEGSICSEQIDMDISHMCRVCGNPNEYLIPIFEGEGVEQNLESKISRHLPIKITEKDKLPTQLCFQCASTLIAWHDMVIDCLEVDKKLKALLLDNKEDVNDEVNQHNSSLEKTISQYVAVTNEELQTEEFVVDSEIQVLTQQAALDPVFGSDQVVKEQAFEDGASEMTSEPRSDSEEGDDYEDIRYNEVNGNLNNEPDIEEELFSENESDEEEFKALYSCTICTASQMTSKEFIKHSQAHSRDERRAALTKLASYKSIADLVAINDAAEYGFKPQPNHQSSVPLYICTVCGQGNLLLKNLDEHRSLHPRHTESHYCNLCQRQLPDASSLTKHLDFHLNNNDLFCQFCNRKFNIIEDLEMHENSHYRSELLCSGCRLNFSSKELIKTHFKETHTEGTICTICDHDFKSENLLDKHFMTHTAATEVKRIVKWFSCEVCEKRYDSKISLQRHILFLHNDRMPIICEFCGFTAYHQDSLKEHAEKEHQRKTYTCGPCNLTFVNKGEFDSHLTTHSTKKRLYSCKLCNSEFTKFGSLKTHLKEHSLLDNIESVDFSVVSSVVVGKKTKFEKVISRLDKIITFTCLLCNEIFDDQEIYNDHLRIHAVKKSTCDLCGKAFKNEADLDEHLNRTHSNKFLKSHAEGDIRGLPFRCNYCDASYRLEFELEEHEKVHEVVVYECHLCLEEFYDKEELQRHLLLSHEEIQEEKDDEEDGEYEEQDYENQDDKEDVEYQDDSDYIDIDNGHVVDDEEEDMSDC